MNKLNDLGMEVLDYKKEYLKDYPKLVHDSIGFAIDSKCESKIITDDIKNRLKNNKINFDDFREFLLKQKSCLKTYEELLVEYEDIRGKMFNQVLENKNCKNLQAFSKVEDEMILFSQKFIISEDFINNYFDIKDAKEFEVLMSRKGFIEKFAILRLSKIFKEFLKNLEYSKKFEVKNTLVFYEQETVSYGIHLEYYLPIDILSDEETINELTKEIIEIAEKANKTFDERMMV